MIITGNNINRCIKFLLVLMLAGILGMLQTVKAEETYHTKRTFTPVEFNLQGTPTVDQLFMETEKLTDIVKGEPIKIDTNGTYAIEKQEAIAIGFDSPVDAWNAAKIYNGTPSNYPGKIFDNVGWVRGTKSASGSWGAYLWILQNRIAFQSSTSVWWRATTNGVPVAITNVMVGSLGDYAPMSNVVDIGPHLVTATNNYPGANQSEAKEFNVDITNVYYQVSIPDIWITPRDAVRCVGGSNVQYSVAGTNIPNGVTWAINPDSLTSGAVIQASNDWHFAGVTPGNIGTNYKVRATSVDNTNFYDEVNFTVVGLQSPLQYKIGTNSWADMQDSLCVFSNTVVYFKAINVPTNAPWPSSKPVWTFEGQSGGVGMEENSHAFTTVSSSTTDYKLVTAECGNTVTGKVIVCTMNSATEATIPANRARTQIGVGERVDIIITPEIGTVTWSVSGGGSLSTTNGINTRFTAPDAVTNCSIVANFEGGSFTKEFSVLAPAGIVSAEIESTTHFTVGQSGAQMHLYPVIVGSTNVSFYRVQLIEVGEDATNITGYFFTNTPPSHIGNGADEWFSLSQDNSWPSAWDWAGLWGSPSPWSSGGFTWNIPARWKVENGATNSMTGWNQIFSIDGSGTITVQKFGHSVTRTTNDVITTY